MGNKAKVFAFTTLVQHGTRSCNQWNKVKKKEKKEKESNSKTYRFTRKS